MRILLIGYYGKHNIGDDLFVQQLSSFLAAQEAVQSVTILCEENYYSLNHSKVDYCLTPQLNWFKRLKLIAQHDVVVWGGGTLAIESEPTSLLRMQRAAKLLGKSFKFLGVGLEGIAESCYASGVQVFKNAGYCSGLKRLEDCPVTSEV